MLVFALCERPPADTVDIDVTVLLAYAVSVSVAPFIRLVMRFDFSVTYKYARAPPQIRNAVPNTAAMRLIGKPADCAVN